MNILIAISTVADGNMAFCKDKTDKDEVVQNRTMFLKNLNIAMQNTTCVKIKYDDNNNYCRYNETNSKRKGDGMFDDNAVNADAIVTQEIGHALFLPLADCVGAAIFDPNKNVLMLSHLGRHSLEQNGGYKSIQFLTENYNCNPNSLLVWLSPAPGQDNYPLFAFNNRSIKDVTIEQLQFAGINAKNINNNCADNTKDLRYFSHSEFLKGNRKDDGRYAIVAMMQD